ncbi:thioredoxin-dependent thiol peroxidase [uncultured Hyphomonas sp.]|uniref:thioredoxin-dependent thiol peroxidase n=1 Tax=uncultured Hyphomonas sp. TaxID=225298 RepID=UPI002AAC126B|nr:thioredoxin-dependent thiol peroxidase [uncultured Hyphomonas sp.]
MAIGPKEGGRAPNFSMDSTQGPIKLGDYKDQTLVLYFYPKDDTPGCTTEAKDFTDLAKEFEKAGAKVVGVSRDTLAKHEKFAAKHDLTVTLASDEDGKVCEAYGVWVEKKNYGRTYMGIERSTFLIGPDKKVIRIWKKVRVKGHAEDVLNVIKSGA